VDSVSDRILLTVYGKQAVVRVVNRTALCVDDSKTVLSVRVRRRMEIMMLICGVGKVWSGRSEDDYRHFWLGVAVLSFGPCRAGHVSG
jgi:hypothetical protein